MERRRRCPMLLAAAAAAMWTGVAAAYGVWNVRDGSYFEDLQDTVDLSLIQAVSIDVAKTTIEVTPGWTWAQPGPSATYLTDTRFSAVGSATTFITVASATEFGEAVQLYTRFFSAVNDMEWNDDCVTGNPTSNNCLLYPIAATGPEALSGARSNLVLLVPDVSSFNRCQTEKTCKGSGDYTFAFMVLAQDVNRDIFMSGHPYNVTWRLRSPGQGPNPPASGAYNDRLAGFTISYTYSTNGTLKTDYLGGATAGCQDLGIGTCSDRSRGCPVRVRLADPPEAASGTLYLNLPGFPDKSPYTPFSFSFILGSGPDIWNPRDCAADLLGGMNVALCHDPPQGHWGFYIHSRGSGIDCSSKATKCPASGASIPCCDPRASASLYIDGMSITAGAGIYLSPAFDSLSPNTLWSAVSWKLDLNADAKGVRTPVELDWRIANTTTGFLMSSTIFDSGVVPGTEDGSVPVPGGVKGRYFQYRALLSSWDQNTVNPPPPASGADACLRYGLQYDGSLQPRVRRFGVAYLPDAGQFVSKAIQPAKLWRWGRVTYRKDDGLGGTVVCDILDADGSVVLSNVASGDSLSAVDPGRHPGIRVRFMLNRNGVAGAAPYVDWFRVTYSPLRGCLAVDHNAIRLSYEEGAAVRFCTAQTGMVDVRIHDAAGQLVKRLFHGELKAGDICQKTWNGTSDPGGRAPSTCALGDANVRGSQVAPGLYFITVTTPAGRETARLAVSR